MLGSDEHFFDVLVLGNDGKEWRMTRVYGWPKSSQKHKSWDMIDNLGRDNDMPWIMGGDLNEILYEAEKKGGLPCDFNNLYSFRNCLGRNGLMDLGAMGHPYNWSNKRSDGFVEERLDRFVATDRWRHLFPLAYVENNI